VPVDGMTGVCEWVGVIPYAELPQVYNPPSGVIVSANQNPFPADYKYPVAGVFAPPYRARQIRARLGGKLGVTDMVELQRDVYSSFFAYLAKQTVAAWEKKPDGNAGSGEAVVELRKWSGTMEKGQAAPMVAVLLYGELRRAIAERAAPGHGAEYGSRAASPVLERLLTERPAGWFKDWDEWLVASLGKAVAEGVKVQGSNVARWDYGQSIELEIKNPVLGNLPFVGGYFNAGPVAMSGSASSIKQFSGNLGPSYRMVVDLADLDASQATLTLGQSGHFLSRHYRDQFDTYYRGESFRMQFGKVDAEETLIVRAIAAR
jgi:penicillin amidase